MNAATAPLSPEALRVHIAHRPADWPGGAVPVVDALRHHSARPTGVVADPLAAPGGPAGELAWQDRQHALRQQLKVLLAGSKLHAGLVTAALGAPRLPEDTEPADPVAHAVERYVERAAAWIEATTRALERRWLPADEAPPGTAPALSDYHRYELARMLVATLRQRPECMEAVEPDRMAACLAAPARTLPPEPSAPSWVSAGSEADLRMAWARTLARVLETAVETPFNRPLDEMLADARAAIARAVERQAPPLAGVLEGSPDAWRVVELHALQIGGQLYAATLSHVYQESTRMIQCYQALLQQGQEEDADWLAQTYQERRLGYVGVPHYFEQIAAVHERQQEAALAAISKVDAVAVSSSEPPATAPAARAGHAVRAPGLGGG